MLFLLIACHLVTIFFIFLQQNFWLSVSTNLKLNTQTLVASQPVLLIYYCKTLYLQISQLNTTHIHYLEVYMGHKFRHSLDVWVLWLWDSDNTVVEVLTKTMVSYEAQLGKYLLSSSRPWLSSGFIRPNTVGLRGQFPAVCWLEASLISLQQKRASPTWQLALSKCAS